MEAKRMNRYVPAKVKKRYEWHKHDVMLHINNLKYEHFVENIDNHFTRAKIVNLDLIHHECHSDNLSYPKYFYEKN